MLLLCLLTILALELVRTHSMLEWDFKIRKRHSIVGGTAITTRTREDMSAVMCASFCTTNCGMLMFSSDLTTCVTFRERFHDKTISWTNNSTWTIIYKGYVVGRCQENTGRTIVAAESEDRTCIHWSWAWNPLQHLSMYNESQLNLVYNGWTMVFRAQSGIMKTAVGYWSDTDIQDDNPLRDTFPLSCLQFGSNRACKRHYRSKVLDNWRDIAEVRFSLYVGEREVRYIVFNGTQTTSMSWFDQKRILVSSWTDLATGPTLNFFTLHGFTDGSCRRSFYIFGPHHGCGTDYAYTLTIEQVRDACDSFWETSETFPSFLYSKTSGSTVLGEKDFGKADALAVFVKFSSK